MKPSEDANSASVREFTAAEIGALAHLYRGEVYRSTIWRTRLDSTTNWSVVTLGIAVSVSFSTKGASPLPLVLVGILIMLFLVLEARRYRFFNVWRARSRWLETHFYAPMLSDGDLHTENGWQQVLARDYCEPHYHISFIRAIGRRLRRSYIWILMIQTIAYVGKITVHPNPLSSMAELFERATVGPIPGVVILLCGLLFNAIWISVALSTLYLDRVKHRGEKSTSSMG